MNTDNFINELAYVLEVSSNEVTMNDELNKFESLGLFSHDDICGCF